MLAQGIAQIMDIVLMELVIVLWVSRDVFVMFVLVQRIAVITGDVSKVFVIVSQDGVASLVTLPNAQTVAMGLNVSTLFVYVPKDVWVLIVVL